MVVSMYSGTRNDRIKTAAIQNYVWPYKMPRELLKRFFLAGFEEYVISAQRSIRNFGKRFMESEMASILVKVGKICLGRHDSKGRSVVIILQLYEIHVIS